MGFESYFFSEAKHGYVDQGNVLVGWGEKIILRMYSKLWLRYLPYKYLRIFRSGTVFTVQGRKLKVDIDPPRKDENDAGLVQLEDYRPIDPVPSSTGSIRPGPIQHDAPLMPYIPEPSPPPSQLQQGGLP
ncbi:UNVERIFIED_CONTAM: hypothetical protein Sangu_1920400 [Sesamum angustifolium]|uniref:Uncharacterized protein n=1 Tax=Sesamum angustifolium TaxID=2727405 RepID=A0AAW2LVC6_9LAMI